jgi:hypothetical protein
MTPPYLEYTHVGILVERLEPAMERLTEALGIRWLGPVERSTTTMIDGEGRDRSAPFRLAYGLDGPPHYELMEMQPGHYYDSALAEGLHHVGGFVDDLEAELTRLTRLGIMPEMTMKRPNGEPTAVYFAPGTLSGIRYEIVDGRLRENFFEMLAAGVK